ncbi:MAG: anion transporter [Burkholderiales bacterium]|nr:anion transporter [Burkholderiales bacterium]
MILGGLPRLKLDRTGVALLGAIAIVGLGDISPEQAAQAIHLPTILLLFAFMVISAQMRLGGFYAAVTRRIVALPGSPARLLAWVIASAALLSAVFSNDIVCLAMAPVLVQACLGRRLDPVPYLLALACAANIGSAATLIGNPQNMLIGEVLGLGFGAYLRDAAPPVLLGLAALWLLLRPSLRALQGTPPAATSEDDPGFDAWQSGKGLAVAGVLLLVFLATGWPRDVAALVGAGLLLLSARFHTRQVTALIDWDLLVLFMSLFVVNHALAHTGVTGQLVQGLRAQGLDLAQTGPLFAATLLLSNLVSNVPAVMLLLPMAGSAGDAAGVGLVLALVSTLAGNLLVVGSIANIIVVDAARRQGVTIDWRRHARTGVPVTLATLAIAAGWLAWRG